MRTRYGHVQAIEDVQSEPELHPTRLWPLLALGVTHYLLLTLFLAMLGAAFSQAPGLGGSGQGGSPFGALFLFLFLFGVFLIAPGYIAFTSGHRDPVTRLIASATVYGLTGYLAASLMINVREEMLLALPMISAGPMLALILPRADAFWTVVRMTLPGALGVLVISLAAVAGDTREISTDMWGVILLMGFAAGLLTLWIAERWRAAGS